MVGNSSLEIGMKSWPSLAFLSKLALLVTLGMIVAACSTKLPENRLNEPSRRSQSIRVGTYNVFTGTHDPYLTSKVIREMQADVVMLQELSPQGARLLDGALEADFPHRHFSEGVAVLSRFPLRNPRYERSRYGINGFLVAEVQSPVGRFQVASLHLDPLHLWTMRDKWSLPYQILFGQDAVHRKEIGQILQTLSPDMPAILCGDFNSVSGEPIRQLRELGYTDSFASVNKHPNRTSTLRFELLGLETGRRIDFILHDSSFHTVESKVLPGNPSDHDPVMSVLHWK